MGQFIYGVFCMNMTTGNDILDNMPLDEYKRIQPYLKPLTLVKDQVLFESGGVIQHVYFPESAAISMWFLLNDDNGIELTTVGRRFMSGAAVIHGPISMYTAVVSVSGNALKLPADVFLREFKQLEYLFRLTIEGVFRYNYHLAGIIACNKRHNTQAQVTRWILGTIEASGQNTVRHTQAEIALMLGVRREAITLVMNDFNRRGIISQSRGSFTLLDKQGLERFACNCHWQERYRLRPTHGESVKIAMTA
jgi:CRP-like cAMP-binding protein